MNRIGAVIFGAKRITEEILDFVSKMHHIDLIIDNNSNLWNERIFGICIAGPDRLNDYDAVTVYILSDHWKEIIFQLYHEYGIETAYRILKENKSSDDAYGVSLINGRPLYLGFEPGKIKEKKCKVQKPHLVNTPPRILIIAYYFPPAGASPVQRTVKFVKYLRRIGYSITVITSALVNRFMSDDTLLREIPSDVTIIRVHDNYKDPQELSVDEQKEIFDFLTMFNNGYEYVTELKEAQTEQLFYMIPDRLIMWTKEVYDAINNDRIRVDADVVYTTVPEWSPHLLGYILKKYRGIPWIADYRDPWAVSEVYAHAVYPEMGEIELSWASKLERLLVDEMDALIVAGDSWKPLFTEKYGIEGDKISIINNGFDEEDFIDIEIDDEKNNSFTICYNGLLGYNRKPAIVLNIINELIHEKVINKDKIRWVINGFVPDYILKNEIEQFDKYKIVTVNGMKSHIESIRISMNSDMMVFFGERGEMAKYNYPGKFYEYLRIRKPILSISDSGSPQSQILEKVGIGKNFGFDDIEGIRVFIRHQYIKWEQSSAKELLEAQGIERYSREKQTFNLARIIEGVK